MSVAITNNLIQGDLEVGLPLLNSDADFVFNSNSIHGNAMLFSRIEKDLDINECTFSFDEMNGLSPEVWFVYKNIFVEGLDVDTIISRYHSGVVEQLYFNFDEPLGNKPLLSPDVVKGVIRCVEFLKQYRKR